MAHKIHHRTARGAQHAVDIDTLATDWGAGHFISGFKHCNDGPLRGLLARARNLTNLSLPRPQTRALMFRDAACDRIWSGLTWFTLPSSCQLFVWDFHQNEEISKGKKRVKTKRFSLIFVRTVNPIH